MGEYERKQKNQLSRAIANNEPRSGQLKEFVDNRFRNSFQDRLSHNLSNSTMQCRLLYEPQEGIDYVWPTDQNNNPMSPQAAGLRSQTQRIASSATKAGALKNISNKAQEIGTNCQGNTWAKGLDYNNIASADLNPFRINIVSAYILNVNQQPKNMELCLDYHFGKFYNGCIVKVNDNEVGQNTEGGTMKNLPGGNYASIHKKSDNIILVDTDSTDNVEQKYDAYTKLAGEGARFQCVKEHIDTIKDDTEIGTLGRGRNGKLNPYVTFSTLWNSWKSFGCKFGINNATVAISLKDKQGLGPKATEGGQDKTFAHPNICVE